MNDLGGASGRNLASIALNRVPVYLLAVVLLVYVVTGMGYLLQLRERNANALALTELRPVQSGERRDLAALQTELTLAQAKLEDEKRVVPLYQESTQYSRVDVVLQVAEEKLVKVLAVNARPLAREDVSGQTYSVLRLEIRAEGGLPQLMAYIDKLRDGGFNGFVLKKARIDMLATAASATIEVAAYSQAKPAAGVAPVAR